MAGLMKYKMLIWAVVLVFIGIKIGGIPPQQRDCKEVPHLHDPTVEKYLLCKVFK